MNRAALLLLTFASLAPAAERSDEWISKRVREMDRPSEVCPNVMWAWARSRAPRGRPIRFASQFHMFAGAAPSAPIPREMPENQALRC